MTPVLQKWLPGVRDQQEIGEARLALLHSIQEGSGERRRQPRVPVSRLRGVVHRQIREELLDFSNLGLAVRVQDRCRFARGEHYRLTLSQGPSSIDVRGLVRWTHSTWETSPGEDSKSYCQIAGLSFDEFHSPEACEEWQFLTAIIKTHPDDLAVTSTKIA